MSFPDPKVELITFPAPDDGVVLSNNFESEIFPSFVPGNARLDPRASMAGKLLALSFVSADNNFLFVEAPSTF